MPVDEKRIRKALWLVRLEKTKVVLLLFVVLVVIGLIIIMPQITIGDSRLVNATVESTGATHGATGSYTYLTCKLDDNELIQVHLHSSLAIPKGTKIVLRESKRLIGVNKYEFVNIKSE